MGNHLQCSNYYCQSVVLKPDWISENCWSINHKFVGEKGFKVVSEKPYVIDRGVIHFSGKHSFKFLCSKECSLTYGDFENIHIPIYLSGKLHILSKNHWKINILFGFNNISLDDCSLLLNSENKMNSLSSSFIGIQLDFLKKKYYLSHSFDKKTVKTKWDNNHSIYFPLKIERIFEKNGFPLTELNFFEIKEQILMNRENIYSETYQTSLISDIKTDQKIYIHIYVDFDKGRNNFFTGEENIDLAIE